MNKSEDLSEEYPEYPEYPVYWQRKQKIINRDETTDHKYHTHSNEQFPLATKT